MTTNYRIAIVGAASIRGKQLNEALSESSFAASEFVLMDDQQALGQLEAVGDEMTFIQPITADSFERIDFTFFAGTAELTRRHWQAAQRAGSSIVDLSAGVGGRSRRAGVRTLGAGGDGRSGRCRRAQSAYAGRRFGSPCCAGARPAAGASAARRGHSPGLRHRTGTGFGVWPGCAGRVAPADGDAAFVSEYPAQVYDVQVAFNTVAAFGEAAKVSLAESEARIRRHYALLSGGRLPQLSLQLIHVPVFHGHTFSIAVEYERQVTLEQIEATPFRSSRGGDPWRCRCARQPQLHRRPGCFGPSPLR